MKHIILTISAIILSSTFSNATEENITDSISIKYEICGNDTVYYKKHSAQSVVTFCGIKQYEEDIFNRLHKQYNQLDFYDLVDMFNSDENNKSGFCKHIVKKFLEGYGKKQCAEFLENYKDLSLPVSLLICVDTDGNVMDIDFIYEPSFAKYMTCEDIIRNTKQFTNSNPIPFFSEYTKMGVKILPPFLIPILRNEIMNYLKVE